MAATAEFSEAEATKDGLPRRAFAYAPTPDPATWKLPFLHADGSPDPAHLPGAAAALSEGGFRGEKAVIPGEAVPAVKAKLRQAYRRWGKSADDMPQSIRESSADVDMLDALLMQEAPDSEADALDMALALRDAFYFEAGDDHPYGAWGGGSKASGGHPGGGGGGSGDTLYRRLFEGGDTAFLSDADLASAIGGARRAGDTAMTRRLANEQANRSKGRRAGSAGALAQMATMAANRGAYGAYAAPFGEASSDDHPYGAWGGGGKSGGGHPVTGGGGGPTNPTRMSVRQHTYRGKEGYLISGKDAAGRSVSIHTASRSSADAIKRKLADPKSVYDDKGLDSLLEAGYDPLVAYADRLREASSDDHPYGAWGGGSKSGGGHAGGGGGDPQLAQAERHVSPVARKAYIHAEGVDPNGTFPVNGKTMTLGGASAELGNPRTTSARRAEILSSIEGHFGSGGTAGRATSTAADRALHREMANRWSGFPEPMRGMEPHGGWLSPEASSRR